ncbi:MAG: hypothetical protein ACR2H3_10265 [Acidimicrobiales bacterium]
MWLFRRRDKNEDTPSPTADSSRAAEATIPPPPRDAWRTAAPIQRTIGPAPHTYRTDDIGDILTSWHSPTLSGELGHQVSAEAPSGTLHGMATAIETGPPTSYAPSTKTDVLRQPPREHADEEAAVGPSASPVTESTETESSPVTTSSPDPVRPLDTAPAPLRTLASSPAPVPTVSRVVAPDVVTPRPLPALALQRTADTGSGSALAVGGGDGGSASATPRTDGDAPAPSDTSQSAAASTAPITAATPPLARPASQDGDGTQDSSGPIVQRRSAPGMEIGPPIQPRAIQRRALPGDHDTASTAPGPQMPLAPVQRTEGAAADELSLSAPESDEQAAPKAATTPDVAVQTEPEATSHAESTAPLVGASDSIAATSPTESEADEMAGGADDTSSGPAMPLQRQTDSGSGHIGLGQPLLSDADHASGSSIESATALDRPAASTIPDLPLAEPGVQRRAESSTATSPSVGPSAASDGPAASGVDRSAASVGVEPTESAAPGGSTALPLAVAPSIPNPSPVTVSTLRGADLVLQRSLDEGSPTLLSASAEAPSPVPATMVAAATPPPPGTIRMPGAAAVQRTSLSPASTPGRPPSTVLATPPAPAPRPLTLAAAPQTVPTSWSDPGDVAVNAGVAQRMPDGSVQFNVQRVGSVRDRVANYEAMSAGSSASAPATESAASPSGTEPSITATATSCPEAPAPEANEREDLEKQARKLWPHIRRRMTNELMSGPNGRKGLR